MMFLNAERFNRNYKLFIRYSATEVVEITPPLNIKFEAKKTIISDINELKIEIINLNLTRRERLLKDKAEQGGYLQVVFQIGYQDNLTDVFIGNVFEASTVKKGSDYITTLICKDGGFDFRNSFTSKTISSNVDVVDEILKDAPNTQKGKVTSNLPRIRPKVLVGNSFNLIEENLEDNQTYFIDNEKLNIINGDELLDDFAVEVSPETGLLNSPQKQETFIISETLFNPVIKVGGQVKLVSNIVKLNTLYRVDTIQFSGEYRGNDWKQTLYMRKSTGFKIVK